MDGLKQAGAQLYIGHSVANMQRNNGRSLPTAIVISSAIPPDNEEILHAKSVGLPVFVSLLLSPPPQIFFFCFCRSAMSFFLFIFMW